MSVLFSLIVLSKNDGLGLIKQDKNNRKVEDFNGDHLSGLEKLQLSVLPRSSQLHLSLEDSDY